MIDERDQRLRDDGWSDLEIGLLDAYEAKVTDFAKETLRASIQWTKMEAVRLYCQGAVFNNYPVDPNTILEMLA